MSRSVWLMVGLMSLYCACGGNDDAESRKKAKVTTTESLAVVTGRIRMAEGFSLPSYAPEDMERKVLLVGAGSMPDMCSPAKESDRKPVALTPEGFLQGIVVAASNFTGATPRPPQTHTVTIKDCRLTPSTVLATKGDMMVLRNEVQFPFMPTFGPSASARTLMPKQKMEIPLDRAGVESVLCTLSAPCGRTDVLTFNHSLSALSDHEGRFRIEHFPVDQAVTLNAWHPLFDEVSIKVTLGAGETKDVELIIAPKRRFQTEEGETGAKSDLTGTPLQRSVLAGEVAAPPKAAEPTPTAEAAKAASAP